MPGTSPRTGAKRRACRRAFRRRQPRGRPHAADGLKVLGSINNSAREETSMEVKPTRRAVVAGLAGAALIDFRALAQGAPQLPKAPVALNIVDVAGNLALTQQAIENYRKLKPNLVSKFTFNKAPAPELPGKIKAQQDAGRVDIDAVLTGIDVLSAGV